MESHIGATFSMAQSVCKKLHRGGDEMERELCR